MHQRPQAVRGRNGAVPGDWNGSFPPGEDVYDPYAWISPLKPYFAQLPRGGGSSSDHLHCMSDTDERSPSSYVMPQSVYGRRFDDPKQAAFTVALFEPWHPFGNGGVIPTLWADGHVSISEGSKP